jgi:hypothetical protein
VPPGSTEAPAPGAFTRTERTVIDRYRTPLAVQGFLNALPYNHEPPAQGETLRSFRGVVRHRTAHCLEAALAAAVILEQHGRPPLVLSFESLDGLDHVIYVYRTRGGWGSIARSRDPGLHGRRPVFRTPRALALSYVDSYVDLTGGITAYAVVDLRVLGNYDWRLADRNVWKVERMLLDHPHRPIRIAPTRLARLRARYRAFTQEFPDLKPISYAGRDRWTELPAEFQGVEDEVERRRKDATRFPLPASRSLKPET